MFAIFKGWSIDGACPFRIVVGKVDDDASATRVEEDNGDGNVNVLVR